MKSPPSPAWIPFSSFDPNSTYVGWCWIFYFNSPTIAYRDHLQFFRHHKYDNTIFPIKHITHVMPISSPEKPQ